MEKQGKSKAPGAITIPGALLVLPTMSFVLYHFIVRPRLMNWGATAEELQQKLPGDDLVPDVHDQLTYAVTIDAPVAAIWPWLMQIGQGRGGWYSYEWLENAMGSDIHNADSIHPEWQNLEIGDLVRMYRKGGGPPPYQVAAIKPQRALIIGHRLLGGNELWGDSWAFVLQQIDERSTRLITRTRWGSSLPTSLHVINYILQPGYFIMYRKMLLGIKQRAEQP